LAEFMGLHVDVDKIALDNKNKVVSFLLLTIIKGVRKCGFLVNQLGKLTREEKDKLRAINKEKYGLSDEFVENMKLPAPCHLVEIFDIDKIMNPRTKLSTI
jgi:hypothetical protein